MKYVECNIGPSVFEAPTAPDDNKAKLPSEPSAKGMRETTQQPRIKSTSRKRAATRAASSSTLSLSCMLINMAV
eukprot:evm.model.NODE_4411_length_24991_cov_22.225641.4